MAISIGRPCIFVNVIPVRMLLISDSVQGSFLQPKCCHQVTVGCIGLDHCTSNNNCNGNIHVSLWCSASDQHYTCQPERRCAGGSVPESTAAAEAHQSGQQHEKSCMGCAARVEKVTFWWNTVTHVHFLVCQLWRAGTYMQLLYYV